MKNIFWGIALIFSLHGCYAIPDSEKINKNERELAESVVQLEIHTGMTQSEVTDLLGSPNGRIRNSEEEETCIYSKIASEVKISRNQNYISLTLFGVITNSGIASSRKTVTIIVKYDNEYFVQKIAYRSNDAK